MLTCRITGIWSDEGLGRDRCYNGAEGECENSQAKGPGLDETLESDSAPKKQFSVPQGQERIFQVNQQRRIDSFSTSFFIVFLFQHRWNNVADIMPVPCKMSAYPGVEYQYHGCLGIWNSAVGANTVPGTTGTQIPLSGCVS